MTARAGDALSHVNLQRASVAIFDGDSAAPNLGGDITGEPLPEGAAVSAVRSARICMAGMSGTNQAEPLHLAIT